MSSEIPTHPGAIEKPATVRHQDEKKRKSFSFWLVIFSLQMIAFISSLDGSILAIALPKISAELSTGDKYVYIANSFVLAQTVIQPTCAQLCNIFGRRYPMIAAVVLFAVGSGIGGGATSTGMLITGRTIQGLGSGGIMLLIELIVCDLVPLRERGTYLGIVLSTAAAGAITGPIVGGALAEENWRWCFYLNLPICAIVILVMVFCLRLRHDRIAWTKVASRVDWTGNTLFIGSICALLLGLIFGGTVYPWSSWRVIAPIIIGCLGWAGFHLYESICKEPCVPPHLFRNRTSAAGFYIVFVSSALLQWVCFFWPVYFMAIRGNSPMRTGVHFLPFMFMLIPGAAAAGIVLSKFGRYRRLHLLGFLLSTLGPGLNVMLKRDTNAGIWAIFQIIDAIGRSLLLPTVLPSILASLTEEDVAAATGMYSFLRSFGYVWGISIPGIIFNNRFNESSYKITDTAVRESLGDGRAYQFATGSYIQSLSPHTKTEVLDVYLDALSLVWIVAVAFGASGIISVLFEKHIPLRTDLDTQYGLEVKEKATGIEAQVDGSAEK